jgi:hypothetical protein
MPAPFTQFPIPTSLLPGQDGVFFPQGTTGSAIATALASASNYILAGGNGAVVELSPVAYTDVSGLDIAAANVALIGRDGTTLKMPSTGATPILSNSGFTTPTSGLSLSANAALFDKTITVSSSAGMAAGQTLQLTFTPTSGARAGSTRVWQFAITNVAGNVISISPGMPEAVLTTDTHEIRTRVLQHGIRLEKIIFDANGNADLADDFAVSVFNSQNSVFRDLEFRDFTSGGGFNVNQGIGNTVENITLSNCGTENASDFQLRAHAASVVRGIRSQVPSGFGPNVRRGCHLCQVSDVVVYGHKTGEFRAIKIGEAQWNSFVNLNISQSDSNGLAITGGSNHNTFTNIISTGCTDYGVWFSDQDDTDNVLMNVISLGNGNKDIALFTSDINNTIVGGKWSTVSNLGTGNIISLS